MFLLILFSTISIAACAAAETSSATLLVESEGSMATLSEASCSAKGVRASATATVEAAKASMRSRSIFWLVATCSEIWLANLFSIASLSVLTTASASLVVAAAAEAAFSTAALSVAACSTPPRLTADNFVADCNLTMSFVTRSTSCRTDCKACWKSCCATCKCCRKSAFALCKTSATFSELGPPATSADVCSTSSELCDFCCCCGSCSCCDCCGG
mmetsp:Transcript_991/g.2207  ORF Transcript_991/g.2207 Transcript_991/m.2207 type:complete len:215 (+) Transcript_991:1163-1807(+)